MKADETFKRLDPLVFQALQLANRMEVATDIFTAASSGNVVFDRYWPSGYAYGVADGLDGDYLINLHRWLPQPDLFILIDSTVEVLRDRRPEARDRYERNAGHLKEVAANYRALWRKMAHEGDSRRWVIIDSYGTKEETATHINAAVAHAREARHGE